ncbi:hypothetical protein [Herpetosiphon geysericola]|uniref:Uncharacterized protein n=1 Tax=Herpetosiphon geysericola TaxID=70996 RepID=A0A0P6Y425_9CHLR|nr:hypothetical protein [Herpetosiphon geysericola]KPL90757.1 hypothetical protein SE18_05165 [Herpetosiphon geysericola]
MTKLILHPIDERAAGSWQQERKRKRLNNAISDSLKFLRLMVDDEKLIRDEIGLTKIRDLEAQRDDPKTGDEERSQLATAISTLEQAITPEQRAQLLAARRATIDADRAYEDARQEYEDWVLARLQTDDGTPVAEALELATKDQIDAMVWNDLEESSVPQLG